MGFAVFSAPSGMLRYSGVFKCVYIFIRAQDVSADSVRRAVFRDEYAVELAARMTPRDTVMPWDRANDLFRLGALFCNANVV